MKPEKFVKLLDEVEEFISDHEHSNPHYLFDEEIIKYFSQYKKKHVKLALEELR
jgi:hypothetical protein